MIALIRSHVEIDPSKLHLCKIHHHRPSKSNAHYTYNVVIDNNLVLATHIILDQICNRQQARAHQFQGYGLMLGRQNNRIPG